MTKALEEVEKDDKYRVENHTQNDIGQVVGCSYRLNANIVCYWLIIHKYAV